MATRQQRELASAQRSGRQSAIGLAFNAAQLTVILLLVFTATTYALVFVTAWADDVAYHIPGAVRIAQHFNPYFVDSPVDSHWYPAGAETFAAVFIAATGSIDSTNVSGAVCFAAICLFIFIAAGLWTGDLTARLACVLCAAAVPMMLGQCLAFYVDIHFALVVCASLWLQAASLMRRQAHYAWVALAMAVLAASVKYSGVQGLVVLIPGCVYCIAAAPRPRWPRWSAALLVVVALAFTAGFYVRNWMVRGNPLFPIDVPGWTRPLLALSPTAYEADPNFLAAIPTLQQAATLPHPWVPESWTRVRLAPDITDGAFGGATTLALAGALLTLAVLRRLDRDRRRAWLAVLVESLALLAIFPLHGGNPRYVLFFPVAVALSPAVLAAALPSGRGRDVVDVLCAAILVNAGIFAWSNLLSDTRTRTSLHQAAPRLFPYAPYTRGIDYAQRGHLRIGYTSGLGNYIARLYDPGLTNELVGLHFRDYSLNHWRQFDSAEAFLAHVRSLDLDYIQIFDPRYPGTALLAAAFPDKVRMPPETAR